MYKGYTQEQLADTFNAVKNQDDWKGPISAVVAGEAVNQIVAAIQFYTATTPMVVLDIATMRYVIHSNGYRTGPAGDH